MQIAGAVFMEIAERLCHDLPKARRAFSMISELREFVCEFRRLGFVLRVHERIRETLQLLAAFPETHRPLIVAAHRLEAQKEVCLTALEDPILLLGDTTGTAETVGNNGSNALPRLPRNLIDDFSPPLLRLVTGSQDRAQEMEFISFHPSKPKEVYRIQFIAFPEPHRIQDEDEATARNGVRPRPFAETHERLRMAFRKTSRAHVRSS